MNDEDMKVHTEKAALGEVVAACPRCGDFGPYKTNQGQWQCAACGHGFAEAAYYQRVPAPVVEPETPESLNED